MASLPFQISAWGVNPRRQALSSCWETGWGWASVPGVFAVSGGLSEERAVAMAETHLMLGLEK
jgi:hypothetical protein